MSPTECEGIPLNCQERSLRCPLDRKDSFGSLTVPGLLRCPTLLPVGDPRQETTVKSGWRARGPRSSKQFLREDDRPPSTALSASCHWNPARDTTADYPALRWFMLVSVPWAGFQRRGAQTSYLILCMRFGATSLIFFSRLSNRDNRTCCVHLL